MPENEATQFLRVWEKETRDKRAKELEKAPPEEKPKESDLSFADVLKPEKEP